jgi:hypothetical protein
VRDGATERDDKLARKILVGVATNAVGAEPQHG